MIRIRCNSSEVVEYCVLKRSHRGQPMDPKIGEGTGKKRDLSKKVNYGFLKVEDFLEVCSESNHREREVCFNHSVAYLQARFVHVFSTDIQWVLRKNDGNLTLATLELRKWKGVRRKIPRSIKDIRCSKKESVPSLQEAKPKTELFTCGCCFEDDLLFEDMSHCIEGHLFCKTCIKKASEENIGNGKSHFRCLNSYCEEEFSLATLQEILEPKVFKKLTQRIQAEEVNAAGIEGLEACPSCIYAVIPAPEDKLFKCLNPECMKVTCRKCKENDHLPLSCEEVRKHTQTKMRTYIENKMTEALVRTCWKCKKTFIKDGGCNKMTCSCGAMMCYICRQPVKNYNHFNHHAEKKSDLCPLFSNDKLFNSIAVKDEALKAREEVMSQNPNVKLVHDPTKVKNISHRRKHVNP